MFSFVINTYKDTSELAECLISIRRFYSDVPILVIDDGGGDPLLKKIIKERKASLIMGMHLRDQVGSWLQRWIKAGIDLKTDVIIKIDPDSRLHKPFVKIPSSPAFGCLMPCFFGEYIHGGCKGFSRNCAIKLNENLEIIANNIPIKTLNIMRTAKYVSEDLFLSWALKSIGIKQEHWSEVAICPLTSKYGFTVTHGHKHNTVV